MFVYAAIGDAFAVAEEFVDKQFHRPFDGRTYNENPNTGLGNGRYTDDTQRMIANWQVIRDNRLSAIAPLHFANAYVEAYKRDPRPGYAMGYKNLLEECESGKDLLVKIRPESKRSGGMMGAAVMGGIGNYWDTIRLTEMQCRVTHNTDEAVEAACAIALAAHYLIHKVGPREDLGVFVNDILKESATIDWRKDRTSWASVDGLECARNAITAWRNAKTTTQVLANAIAYGGDTDSVACSAMAMAWADPTIKDDLHTDLHTNLEHGEYGFPYLFDQSVLFKEKFVD